MKKKKSSLAIFHLIGLIAIIFIVIVTIFQTHINIVNNEKK